MSDRYHSQTTRPNEIIAWFENKLRVFVALTNYFRKNFLCYSLILHSFDFSVIFFAVKWRIVPSQRSNHFLGCLNQSRQFFQLLSNVCFDFEYNCFKKKSVNFWTLPLFLSYFSRLSAQKETDFLWVIN